MKEYHGIAASEGLVVGTVRKLEHGTIGLSRIIEDPHRERALLDAAVVMAKDELEDVCAKAQPTERDIFTFQIYLLEDEGLLQEAFNYIAAGAGAAAAMERVGKLYADRLAGMKDNEYMQLRSADVIDACRRVVDILDGRPRQKLELDHPVILASDILLPSDIASVPRGMILGLATSSGSVQSHAAIIARSLSIPGVVQLGHDFLENCDGRTLAMDAQTGYCVLDPDSKTHQGMVARICKKQHEDEKLAALRDVPCLSRDGVPFQMMANCFGPEDIEVAIAAGAGGVGLLRTEYLMLQGHTPDEQEQYFFYTSCIAAAAGRPVVFRTFDVGADKTTEELSALEPRSALGLRGIRYCLSHPRMFENQICALLRAGARGPMCIMLPMVSRLEDWDAAMHVVDHCKEILRRRGVPFDEKPRIGITVEVPSVCLMADEFAQRGCGFFSIGTNDLVQYTHAADRDLSQLEVYYQTNSPAVQKLIDMTVAAAARANIPVGVCGLSVATPEYAGSYLKAGLRAFSVEAQDLFHVKKVLLETAALPEAEPALPGGAAPEK